LAKESLLLDLTRLLWKFVNFIQTAVITVLI